MVTPLKTPAPCWRTIQACCGFAGILIQGVHTSVNAARGLRAPRLQRQLTLVLHIAQLELVIELHALRLKLKNDLLVIR